MRVGEGRPGVIYLSKEPKCRKRIRKDDRIGFFIPNFFTLQSFVDEERKKGGGRAHRVFTIHCLY